MLITIAVSGYRSVRDLVLPLDRLNVISGANGSGKSSLYRSIRLLADTAQGAVAASLAREGGLTSALWAGPERFSAAMKRGEQPVQGTIRKESVSLRLGFADEDYGYAVDLGLPVPASSAFNGDPVIKAEAVWTGEKLARHNVFAERRGPHVGVLDETGARKTVMSGLPSFDSMMTHAADPKNAPELLQLRERMRSWRFYDHFRSDFEAPARLPQVGTRTPVLASDGADLAAALQTIVEIGDRDALLEAVDDAFPGSAVEVSVSPDGMFETRMRQHGLLRSLRASELSDGTLRYLCLVAALLSPRPPPLMVLNEPETSLHPSLLAPLARLLSRTCLSSQFIVVTHSHTLAEALRDQGTARFFTLKKELGETVVEEEYEKPAWVWPSR
ncbi:AAA family ATPase [uncultured Nitratireductor sp.]|uniref:AAA family ATPase n=1 Tax=uncultured Nitratireductor sp. TaxID=520953 RepID=UPI0025F2335C|nr:AAA family ATPase [uncultured Nitratireductor sp.]